MIKSKPFLVAYKLLFGLLAISGLLGEVIVLSNQHRFVAGNFLSFFTVESNGFAAVMLIVSAIAVMRGKPIKYLPMLRGATTLYMVTTGLVFSILLSGLDASLLTAVPWDNTVLHYIMPLAVLVDWLIDPPEVAIPFKTAIAWLAYPLTYLVYSLVRGSIRWLVPLPILRSC